jgi:hypothetical protein
MDWQAHLLGTLHGAVEQRPPLLGSPPSSQQRRLFRNDNYLQGKYLSSARTG